MKKVLFLTNVPSPYRVDFFCELGKQTELTVIYERKSASDRNKNWISKSEKTYKEVFLDGLKISNDNSFCINIIKYLNLGYDYIIIGMYSTFTAMIAIEYLKKKKIPFIISTDRWFFKE